jgi:IPT/TIG domain
MNKLIGLIVCALVCVVSFISVGYGQAVITSVTPNLGVTSGNTIVTIAGNNFQTPNAVTAVTFGTTPAYNFIVTSNNSITAQTSANIAGTADIYLTTNTGIISTANSADHYTFDTPPTYASPAVTVNVTQNVAFTTLNTGF